MLARKTTSNCTYLVRTNENGNGLLLLVVNALAVECFRIDVAQYAVGRGAEGVLTLAHRKSLLCCPHVAHV